MSCQGVQAGALCERRHVSRRARQHPQVSPGERPSASKEAAAMNNEQAINSIDTRNASALDRLALSALDQLAIIEGQCLVEDPKQLAMVLTIGNISLELARRTGEDRWPLIQALERGIEALAEKRGDIAPGREIISRVRAGEVVETTDESPGSLEENVHDTLTRCANGQRSDAPHAAAMWHVAELAVWSTDRTSNSSFADAITWCALGIVAALPHATRDGDVAYLVRALATEARGLGGVGTKPGPFVVLS